MPTRSYATNRLSLRTTKATIRKVMPDHNKLIVKKKTAIAASAAIGEANKKPIMTIATNAIINRITLILIRKS